MNPAIFTTPTSDDQETRRRILLGLLYRMLGQSMPPAPTQGPDGIETFKVPEPVYLHSKFLVQAAVPVSAMPCKCELCQQMLKSSLQTALGEFARVWLDSQGFPLCEVKIVREP